MKSLNKSDITLLLKENSEVFFLQISKEWVSANWNFLCKFKPKDINSYDKRAQILLFLASACQHNNDYKRAKNYFNIAIKWGSSLEEVMSICLADISNTKAKIDASSKNKKTMNENFFNSVNIFLIEEHSLAAHQRSVNELKNLGLLPQATEEIKKQFNLIAEHTNNTDENINVKITILKTELEMLTNELSLSQQRMFIDRFDKNTPVKELTDIKKRSVSQLGQDIWVLEQTNFKKNGFFVEFGATDGVLLSNTYLLEKEFEWQGICAEPNPKFYMNLKKNRKCKVSDACIYSISGEEVEFIFAQEYGGMQKHMSDDMHAEKREAYKMAGNVTSLITISLHDFLVQNCAPNKIDYLSIDTEGSEFEILQSFPFELWDIRLLTVEHNYTEQREKIFNLLSSLGYRRIEKKFDDWYIKE